MLILVFLLDFLICLAIALLLTPAPRKHKDET